jgi:1,4-alpha-glucan branching enzyme
LDKLREWIDWKIYDSLIAEKCDVPHDLLGIHECGGDQVVTVYRPCAISISVIDDKTDKEYKLEEISDNGFFGAYIVGGKIGSYTVSVKYSEDDVIEFKDPYSFEPVIGELDRYLFAEGNHTSIYKKLGSHPMELNGVKGTSFAVWAPNAKGVSVVGDFNMWDGRMHQMRRHGSSGIYELFIPGVAEGAVYKYRITSAKGDKLYKTDPYGNYSELRPGNASVVYDIYDYKWKDASWINRRRKIDRETRRRMPMNIYECHIGSWRKHNDGTEDGFYTYREAANQLGDYLVKMSYTHVELMGIAEYPFDGSWGYQVVGYYAPTSRYGTPDDFKYFVDHMHNLGIGVILDWVPAHFPRDEHGLGRFDGTPLYEHPDPRRGEHPDWGTYIFNYGKTEVSNFLIANAIFWAREYHIDGLRVDAVASMLYLDYGKRDGEWLPNPDGSKENREAIAMLKKLNSVVPKEEPGVYVIAEESTSWSGVTAPVELDGLGFLFKWNMGWMNDFLEYMKTDPYFRAGNHNKLCFSMMYAYSENFIQVLSHDEVVHGKASMIYKMPGDMRNKFSNLKAAYGFMYGHPGKKLLFMGQEFAQTREWSEARELDWELLQYPEHIGMQKYIKDLNKFYITYDALHFNDYDPMGFEWMSCDDNNNSIVSFVRRGSTPGKQLLFVCNFTPVLHDKYRIPVPCKGVYSLIMNSDDAKYGGDGTKVSTNIKSDKIFCGGKDDSIELVVPPLSTVIFRYNYKEEIQ